MKLAIITVLFQTPNSDKERIRSQAKSLGFTDWVFYEIDNTSTGKGFAQGVNEGIRRGIKDGADLFLIINPDISFDKITAATVQSGLSEFDVWGYAMKQAGKTYYGGVIQKWRMSGGLTEKKPERRFQNVDYVTGSFMLIKRKVIEKIGMFEEGYFMYYEDVDYCERARRAGYKVGIDASYEYIHFENSKTYEGKQYQLAKNRLLFLLKFGSWRQKLRELIRLPITIVEDRILLTTFLKSGFFASFLSMNASGFIGKGLNFLLFLVLIRHIPLQDYGIYTLVWAHVSLLSPLVDFGTTSYGMIYLPRQKESQVNSLFSLRFFLSLIVFFLTILLSFIFRYPNQVFVYIFLTSFVIFNNMVGGTYLIICSIDNKLVRNSIISIVTNTFMITVFVLAVLKTGSLPVLFYLIALFYIVYTILFFWLVRSSVRNFRIVFPVKEWWQVIKKSYVFVLISLFAGIYFKIDVFILNFLKGVGAVGVYSSGYKFLEATILLAASYNTLSAPILSRTAHGNRRKLLPTMFKHFLFLALVGAGVVVLTQLSGSWFLPYILKGNYTQAVDVVKIVIWALPFILLNSIYFNTLYAVDLSKVVIYLFAAMSVINTVLNLIFIPRFSFMASAYITVFSEIFDFVILTLFFFAFYRKKIFYA